LTLQTFFVYLAGLILDPWTAAAGQLLYLLLGLGGLPVFAGGVVGPQALFGPTGGFLISFPLAALVESTIAGHHQKAADAIALGAGCLIIFGIGISFFSLYFQRQGLVVALLSFSPYIAWDALKAALAYQVSRHVRKMDGRC